jgi:hypothetical protein
MTDPVTSLWIEMLHAAWRCAVADAKPRDPRSRRAPLFDSHGLHPWSELVGQINACQALEPVLIHAAFSPVLMKKAAEAAAWEEHVEELRSAA